MNKNQIKVDRKLATKLQKTLDERGSKPLGQPSEALVLATTGWHGGTYNVGDVRKMKPEGGCTHECTVSKSAFNYAMYWWDADESRWAFGYMSQPERLNTEREYPIQYSREVAWENHMSDCCQVFAEDIAGAVILGVETLKMESLVAVDHSDVRVIGVVETPDK